MSHVGSSLVDAGDSGVIVGCILACQQCVFIASTLTAEQYVKRRASHRSIGEHMRHCLEHFQLFLHGLGVGCIDYDARRRDVDVETSPTRFLDAMAEVISRLKSLDGVPLDTELTVRMQVAPDCKKSDVKSTLGRELAFLSSHAIHHIAVVTLLAEAIGISLPEGYGVAYSTSAHRASLGNAPAEGNLPSNAH